MTALLTIEQVAGLLTLSPSAVRRRVETGDLRAIRLGDGPKAPVRIESSEVAHYLRRGAERAIERRA